MRRDAVIDALDGPVVHSDPFYSSPKVNGRKSSLERNIVQLGCALIGMVLAPCVFVVVAGWLESHGLLDTFRVGVSLATPEAPERLPGVTAITLAQCAPKMRALISRLHAVETLGPEAPSPIQIRAAP